RASVYHHPEVLFLIVLKLDKVIPAAEAAELADPAFLGLVGDSPGVFHRDEVALRAAGAMVTERRRSVPDDLLKLFLIHGKLAAASHSECDLLHDPLGESPPLLVVHPL